MKYLPLVWAALLRHKQRTVLTLLSVLVAFLLFGLLDTVRSTFANAGQTEAGRYRLNVMPRTGLGIRTLPHRLLAQIEEVPGVAAVDYASFIRGTYQDPKNSIRVEAHPEAFFDVQPEASAAPEERRAWARTRSGVLVGEALVKKYGWKVGDKIPLQTKQAQKDGSTVWTFDVVGTFRYTDPHMKVWEDALLANWDYVDEARALDVGTVVIYAVKVSNLSDMDRVGQDIEAVSANSDHETRTENDNEMNKAMFRRYGDMGTIVTSIMGAVFFTLLLLTGHTMARAVQERIPELAVLKTLGFTGRKILGLVLCESVVLILFGALIGLGIAMAAVVGVRSAHVLPVPILSMSVEIWMRGLLLATIIGLCVGALPAIWGMRLRIADALSHR